jgi:hypothetical protein
LGEIDRVGGILTAYGPEHGFHLAEGLMVESSHPGVTSFQAT